MLETHRELSDIIFNFQAVGLDPIEAMSTFPDCWCDNSFDQKEAEFHWKRNLK